MKKAVILLLLCFVFTSVATTSKANSALMSTLRQNARQLITLSSGPTFPFIDVAWSYNGSSFTVTTWYIASYTIYTYEPGSYTIIGAIELNVDQYGNPGDHTYTIGVPGTADFSGYINTTTGIYTWTLPDPSAAILDFGISDVTPRSWGGYPVWITEGNPTPTSYFY